MKKNIVTQVNDNADFLRIMFPKIIQGYIRLVFVKDGLWPGRVQWLSVDQIHGLNEFPIKDEYDCYFTPHTYKTKGNARKENASDFGHCVWMDSDEQFWSPWMIIERQPSVVIRTSPKKYHAYWRLDKPYLLKDIEKVNKQLAHTYLKVDKSGWDISQLLRLPFTRNNKYQERYFVNIVQDYTDFSSVCSLDPFSSLPCVDNVKKEEEVSLPCDQDLESVDFILYKYKSLITQQHRNLIDIASQDRSLTLWRLYHSCKDIGMTRTETYVIARSSPNNKFTGYRRDGDFFLWKDICQAYHRKNAPGHILQKVLFYINRSRNMPIQERKQKVSEIIWEDMKLKGRFLVSKSDRQLYFYYCKKFIKITQKSRELQVYLELHYEINASTSYYNYVSSHIYTMGISSSVEAKFASRSYYDNESNILYVNNFDGGVWMCDGDEIKLIDNGFCENIFFINDTSSCEKFTPDFSASPDVLNNFIFKKPNFSGTEKQQDMAIFFSRVWTFSLFFPEIMVTRPILVVEGSHGSGKTTLFKCIEWVITGSDECVKDMPLDANSFREIVRGKNHVIFDNVDLSFKGLVNLLAVIATGTKEVKRILYTDNERAEYWLKASIGITTMCAKFFRQDVADRCIPLRVDRLTNYISESSIKEQVMQNRGLIWGDLLLNLNQIVKNLGTMPTDISYKLRMADFAKLIQAYCDGCHVKASKYITVMFEDQASRHLSSNPIWDCLLPFSQDKKNQDKPWQLNILHNKLTKFALRNNIDYSLYCPSPRKLGFELVKLAPSVNTFLHMEKVRIEGKVCWFFKKHENQ